MTKSPTSSTVLASTELGKGFTIDQLIDSNNTFYYRVCSPQVCRYCEDEYVSHMYAAQMGYSPA